MFFSFFNVYHFLGLGRGMFSQILGLGVFSHILGLCGYSPIFWGLGVLSHILGLGGAGGAGVKCKSRAQRSSVQSHPPSLLISNYKQPGGALHMDQ